MWHMHQSAWELCWKTVIPQWNKQVTYCVVRTSHSIFLTKEISITGHHLYTPCSLWLLWIVCTVTLSKFKLWLRGKRRVLHTTGGAASICSECLPTLGEISTDQVQCSEAVSQVTEHHIILQVTNRSTLSMYRALQGAHLLTANTFPGTFQGQGPCALYTTDTQADYNSTSVLLKHIHNSSPNI